MLLPALAGIASAVQVHQVTRDDRTVQLDGFLLEWKKVEARPLAGDSLWFYDAVNTREGLTGYFKTDRFPSCLSWKFRFLPDRLSPYNALEVQTNPDSAKPYYKVSLSSEPQRQGVTVEWIIPWDSIWHDSSGSYQVRLFGADTCGDTLQAVIFSGHVFRPRESIWGGVYVKGIFLGSFLIVLFVLQKRARSKLKARRKRPWAVDN
jgi:hypothetical protein